MLTCVTCTTDVSHWVGVGWGFNVHVNLRLTSRHWVGLGWGVNVHVNLRHMQTSRHWVGVEGGGQKGRCFPVEFVKKVPRKDSFVG